MASPSVLMLLLLLLLVLEGLSKKDHVSSFRQKGWLLRQPLYSLAYLYLVLLYAPVYIPV